MHYRRYCCGNNTLLDDSDDICSVCWWQDDILQREYPDYKGGPNHGTSLNEAKNNYRMFGVLDMEYIDEVRKPYPEELPKNNR